MAAADEIIRAIESNPEGADVPSLLEGLVGELGGNTWIIRHVHPNALAWYVIALLARRMGGGH